MRANSHKVDEKAVNLIKDVLIDDWVVRDPSGRDYGIDLQLERYNNDSPTGDFVFVQVKGTEKEFSDEVKLGGFPTKTINYALLFSVPFFVFYTSISSKKVKYVWLQKYVETHLDVKNPSWKQQDSITIEFPVENDIESNIDKIISISSYEKSVKIAHKFIMLCEKYFQFYKQLKNGDFKKARICHGLLCSMLKIRCFEEFGGDFVLGRNEADRKTALIMCTFIFEKAETQHIINEEEFSRLDLLCESLRHCKQHAVNIELNQGIAAWINETVPF